MTIKKDLPDNKVIVEGPLLDLVLATDVVPLALVGHQFSEKIQKLKNEFMPDALLSRY